MASSSPTTAHLRDHLLQSLRGLPGSRELHIHVLVTAPRKYQNLFPYATPRPRSYAQDVLILVSEEVNDEAERVKDEVKEDSSSTSEVELPKPRVFTTALEAAVYTIPSTSSAILYISKLDSTGQGINPSPTRTIASSFIQYYSDPKTRPIPARHLWVHLFARAQGQYLFPNSSECEVKKPLSDIRLCAWWRSVVGNAVAEVAGGEAVIKKSYYLLPGMSEFEADQAMRRVSSSSTVKGEWIYGHPYSQGNIPLPCPPHAQDAPLGHFIPWFDDCPKSRFIDEMASDIEAGHSPPRKRIRTTTEGASRDKKDKVSHMGGELGKVSIDDFWERMSFRQECVAGAITGFFVGIVSCLLSDLPQEVQNMSPLAPQPGQVAEAVNKRVLNGLMTGVEFSTRERALKGTAAVEATIKSLCDGMARVPVPIATGKPKKVVGTGGRKTPEPGEKPRFLVPPSTPPRKGSSHVPDVSPNPFPEPIASLETYDCHIHGQIRVENAPITRESRSETHVTVLTVRKKRKQN